MMFPLVDLLTLYSISRHPVQNNQRYSTAFCLSYSVFVVSTKQLVPTQMTEATFEVDEFISMTNYVLISIRDIYICISILQNTLIHLVLYIILCSKLIFLEVVTIIV